YADTPVDLCQRAGKSEHHCSYARFVHVPPVATNVSITTIGLMPIIGTTQCMEGPVDMNVYAKGREQQDLGLLGHGLTCHPDTVAVKAHFLISNGMELEEHLHTDLCGENPLRL
ncbi:MAG: hypothetical protein VX919_00050, partial [Candidatus Thermoplasmatota archaeon]|nr:hypothetical protein [Candidatus Thermoplasmatota archaeon]